MYSIVTLKWRIAETYHCSFDLRLEPITIFRDQLRESKISYLCKKIVVQQYVACFDIPMNNRRMSIFMQVRQTSC
jgi:hypothetical protein